MRQTAVAYLAFLILCVPALAQTGPSNSAIDLSALVATADRNGDGRIDRSEMEAALVRSAASDPAAFERDWEERNAPVFLGAPDAAASRDLARAGLRTLRDADANGDGKVTREEAQAYLERQPAGRRQAAAYGLALGDPDFDGTATADEIGALERRVTDEQAKLAPAPEETDDARRAKADARKDFMEARSREREQVMETWRTFSDANNAVPAADLRRELLSSTLR